MELSSQCPRQQQGLAHRLSVGQRQSENRANDFSITFWAWGAFEIVATVHFVDTAMTPLELRHQPKREVQRRTKEIANELGITHLLERGIKGLSGGESQRVALGRALSFRPSVLLLDEPLSALDQSTRSEMYELLRRVTRTYHVTTLHITHSEEEAESMADIRYELSEGQVNRVSSSPSLDTGLAEW